MALAVCFLVGSLVSGTIFFKQDSSCQPTKVFGKVRGLTPGLHGFHVHQFGVTDDDCATAGSHFNPEGKNHGGPKDTERHAGDLGNIEANRCGVAKVRISDKQIPLVGENSIIGRAVVVHAMEDDLGRGGNEESLRTGNAGSRVACCTIKSLYSWY